MLISVELEGASVLKKNWWFFNIQIKDIALSPFLDKENKSLWDFGP